LDVLKAAQMDKLFFLSGGIEPTDVEKLREFSKEPIANKLFLLISTADLN